MTTLMDPRDMMADHVSTLREYAGRVVVHRASLTSEEEADRAGRMREYRAIGSSFGLTDREMVGQIYRGLFRSKRGCDCPSCKARPAQKA